MADAVTIDIAREPNLHRWAHPLVLPWLLLTPPLALGAYLAACGCLGELRWLGVLILALAARSPRYTLGCSPCYTRSVCPA